jgi:two-component system capsular synthesis sensor histidine kinase RcsC
MGGTMTDCENTPRRLLVIDDDPAFRKTIAHALQTLGHVVAEAESGSVGLAILREQPVDLVMTDLNMPGLTGWAVARLVKAMYPNLPVVLVTGDAHVMQVDRPERRYVDVLLAKPYDLAEIQAVIDALTRDRADALGSRTPARGGLATVRGWQTSTTGSGTL